MKTIFNVEKICGTKVGEYSLDNIQNNPNFIFENDPNYETVVLYNSEGIDLDRFLTLFAFTQVLLVL